MDWKLELVVVPVSDVDRAKDFYAGKVGFEVDHDTRVGDDLRVVQLTPPGSACSIAIGTGIAEMPAGSLQGLQLVVPDVGAARAELAERGVEVGEVQALVEGEWVDAAPPYDDWNAFVFFKDPDGNGWAVQQGPARG
jgi:catechol 2,3-dioxygenase-like lactoylglutathione lyase family enzyme